MMMTKHLVIGMYMISFDILLEDIKIIRKFTHMIHKDNTCCNRLNMIILNEYDLFLYPMKS